MITKVQDVQDLHFPDLLQGDYWVCMDASGPGLAGLPYVCTRPKGHSGRHSASDSFEIVAVWGAK